MDKSSRLPINIVTPRETDYKAVSGGGSEKLSDEYTEELRFSIEEQLVNLQADLSKSFELYPTTPCIAKVIMKEKKIAKSHKPIALFKPETCPIVGAEKLNEVLIKVTPTGMKRLLNLVKSTTTIAQRNCLTKIDRIVPYSLDEKNDIPSFNNVTEINQPLKVKLFTFSDPATKDYYTHGFELLLKKLNIMEDASKIHYSNRSIGV